MVERSEEGFLARRGDCSVRDCGFRIKLSLARMFSPKQLVLAAINCSLTARLGTTRKSGQYEDAGEAEKSPVRAITAVYLGEGGERELWRIGSVEDGGWREKER